MKEIIPNVNDNLNMTELEKKYKDILNKLNKRKRQRGFGILGIVTGFAGVGVLLAAFLSLSAGNIGAVMSFSPWLYVPTMTLVGALVSAGWTALLINPEIKELKKLERRYAPDIAKDRREELEKVAENEKSLSEMKQENDRFLSDKRKQLEENISKEATAKVDIAKNIELAKPKEDFSPTEQLEFLKKLKEQAEEFDTKRKKEFMNTMMNGMNDDKKTR